MSTEKLDKEESRKKIKSLVGDIKVAMMITGFDQKPIPAIPMTTKKIDNDGNIWFLSLRNSHHNQNLLKDKQVQLLYSDPSDMEYLSVYGEAEVTTDRAVLEDLYEKTDDNWFEEIDDPNLTAIKVRPEEAYYWDTKTNKYITLLKLGVGAITGNKQDIGEKGELDI
ncbi:pyridoxamine 5'-phosphate oxidase family protein [Salinimicrobium gaetbulicola]|uniref:Pyridoxamine 5'-phosphate oxidase family protein n=1 Tax=Salinimicrobium gaetbulicola TaxID=999702 RepID=A0ABW3IFY7_9FLAO